MSTTTFKLTRAQALALKPCSASKVPDFGTKKYFTPQDAFDSGVSVCDFMWVLGKTGHKWIAVKMALKYAESVSSLNPDPRVQAAIDAAWNLVNNPSDPTAAKSAAREAANAAARAADWAAARASWAAADAAWAAADAAARAAADAAAWAAADAAARTSDLAAARASWAAADAADAAARAATDAGTTLRWIDVFNEVTRDNIV